MSDLTTLHRQRGLLKRKITEFKAFLNTLRNKQLSNVDIKELETRIERISPIIDQVGEIQNKIFELKIEDPQMEEEYIVEFEKTYFSVIAEARALLEESSTPVINTPGPASSAGSDLGSYNVLNGVKLPTLSLPKFLGGHTQWIEFHDTFSSLIHSNEALNAVQKFHYLRACLEGDASDIIKSLPISTVNYAIAWNLLCERFTNKKLLIQKHLSELFLLKEISKESASHLREISDAVTRNLRSLESLGLEIEKWDPIIIHLVITKLDKRTIRDWESSSFADELPTLEELKTFLNNKADLLDNVQSCQGESKDKRENKQKGNSKTFITTKLSCYFCKGQHTIYKCSKFLKLSVKERINKVNELNLCSNCLRNTHVVKNCDAHSRGCKTCKENHNTLLHCEAKTENNVIDTPNEEVSLSTQVKLRQGQVLLATALVQVCDANGEWHDCRALLDSASQSNFITTEFHSKLGLNKHKVHIAIQGINQVVSDINSQCFVKLKSRIKHFTADLRCLILDKISDDLPVVSIDTSSLQIPENIGLADPTFDVPNTIDLLIGAQLFRNLFIQGQIKLGKTLPVLQNTYLSWILSGPLQTPSSRVSQCYFTNTIDIQTQLQQFWELEECPKTRSLSQEELTCEAHFLDTLEFDSSGRYIVSIPFKDSPQRLGQSRSIAEKRFMSLEKRLNGNPMLKQSYSEFMNEYIALGHMSLVKYPDDNVPHYYMPHHGVTNESSLTTRLRVVFDGSCPTSNGVSVNDLQMVGATVQSDLFSILIRFRQHLIAFSADIQKMYRQILISPSERCFQRILWRNDSSSDPLTYELNTVTYGTASAPFLATRCLRHIANTNQTKFPDACDIIRSDIYADDILSGGDSPEEVIRLCTEISTLLGNAHFPLHKWISNSPEVVDQFSTLGSETVIVSMGRNEARKTLGLYWEPLSDSLTYKVKLNSNSDKVTKRHILATLSQIYDPLGLLSPSIIIGKMIMQLLWQEKIGWDDDVPGSISEKWINLQRELPKFNDLKIPRHIFCINYVRIELHGFSDASEKAYSACIYAKSIDSVGNTQVNLICSKSKVAPLKTLTIPRLELCSAHLLSRLITVVKNSLRINVSNTYLWSDSSIVLAWIKASPHILKVFVSHRVTDIQAHSENCTWLHVPTSNNPADVASRGLLPQQLRDSELWWNGPKWLKLEMSQWPSQSSCSAISTLPEVKRMEYAFSAFVAEFPIPISNFSLYTRLVRTTAFCLRFINNCRKKMSERNYGILSVGEIDQAVTYIIRAVQQSGFASEVAALKQNQPLSSKSKILALKPFLDSDGLLRLGGRLQNPNLTLSQKHPLLLPQHHFTKILFEHQHKRLCHAGPQLLLSSIRDKYWPLQGKNYARATVHKCLRCFRCKPSNINPQMGNLPADRVSQTLPFQVVGVDYAGPLLIKDKPGRGCKSYKCYVALFVCFLTKAIHIELVSSLSTDAFLSALRRFIARRGKPTKIYSDNGSNFVGANNELKTVVTQLNHETSLNDYLALEGIIWNFIPPNSSHFEGLWETGVKSIKFHLKRVAGSQLLTFEQLYTLLVQIESVLNSRQLTAMSSNPDDLEPLTPSHFLIGRKISSLPEHSLLHIPQTRLGCFQRIQQLFQTFWSRWRTEYLHSLQQCKKWIQQPSNTTIGTMVLLKIDDAPPLSWPVGRIIEVFPGRDGIVRVVSVRTNQGVYKRAVSKIYPLPLDEFPCASESETSGH